ncbi:hypothetical protein Droror1_Dr00008323 [Drosera rotundifolia]
MLLNFLDVNEMMWRFRYSYWNSSRNYVLSKGWTWFVKDKNLKAGDVVTFERSSGQDKQLCISFTSGEEVQSGDKCCRIRPLVLVVRLIGVDIGRILVTDGGVLHASLAHQQEQWDGEIQAIYMSAPLRNFGQTWCKCSYAVAQN